MPTSRKPVKSLSPAEKQRREMAATKQGERKESPLAKERLTNDEAKALMEQELKARQLQRMDSRKRMQITKALQDELAGIKRRIG